MTEDYPMRVLIASGAGGGTAKKVSANFSILMDLDVH